MNLLTSFATDLVGKKVQVIQSDYESHVPRVKGTARVRAIGPSPTPNALAVVVLEVIPFDYFGLSGHTTMQASDAPAGLLPDGMLIAMTWDHNLGLRLVQESP